VEFEMSEQNLEEVANDAIAATEMLHSAVFNKAFEEMNRQIVDQIMASPPEAEKERERLYSMFKAGQMFVQQFAGLINKYELAKQQKDV
jgi:hypothetical protein